MQKHTSTKRVFRFGDREYHFPGPPLIMGILNVTPDSFSDGGLYADSSRALEQARQMIAEGADIIDIGGESTRPGAPEVAAEEEKKRVLPIIQALARETDTIISIDTRKSTVAREAVMAGAEIINDVSGLHHDPAMLEVLRQSRAGVIIMHMRGTPQNMQQMTDYDNLTGEIFTYFQQILDRLTEQGIALERILLDPGIGFGKTVEHNLQLIARLPEFATLGRPLLVGPSRKSFIGKILNQPQPRNRDWGTAGAVGAAVIRGADVIRVHNVQAMRETAVIAGAIRDHLT